MTATHDLIARLRKLCPPNGEWINLAQYACKEAADALETLQRERDEAVAKLEARDAETVGYIQPDHLQKARQAPMLCRVEPVQRDGLIAIYTNPPTGDAAGKDSVDAALEAALHKSIKFLSKPDQGRVMGAFREARAAIASLTNPSKGNDNA